MATKKITDNLVQIVRFGMVNCYLVLEDDGVTLIDAAMPGSHKMILRAAEVTNRPIRRIVLTHAHVDHTGALDALVTLLPQAEVLFSARTERLLTGDLSVEPDEPHTPLKGGFPSRSTRATRSIEAGDRVGSLQAVAAQGHSPDQLAFFDERESTLLCGDAFQTKGGIAVAGVMRRRFPFPAMATWDLGLATESARRLVELGPARLAPGHGRVLEDPVKLMKQAIAEAEKRLDREKG